MVSQPEAFFPWGERFCTTPLSVRTRDFRLLTRQLVICFHVSYLFIPPALFVASSFLFDSCPPSSVGPEVIRSADSERSVHSCP
jgi:hypothetical protein